MGNWNCHCTARRIFDPISQQWTQSGTPESVGSGGQSGLLPAHCRPRWCNQSKLRSDFLAPDEQIQGDWAEDNDTFESADLRGVTGWNQWDALSISPTGDIDWFTFETYVASNEDHYVAIQLDHSAGDIDLAPTMIRVICCISQTDNDIEYISLGGLPAGSYYIRMNGARDKPTLPTS